MRGYGRIAAIALGFGTAVAVWVTLTTSGGSPVDAACYFGIDAARPYATECWLYSPPFAILVGGLQAVIPFGAFVALLRAAELAALGAVVGPAAGLVAFVPQVATELNAANINLLLLAAILFGLRRPWLWSFVVLAKVTPGIGLLWFVVRREWRSLAIALAATAAIAGASFVVAPWLWFDYVGKLAVAPDETGWPVGLRLPLAAALVVWGARTNRRWVLPIALFLSLPRLYFLSPVVLVGVLAFVRWSAIRGLVTLVAPGRIPQPAATSGTTVMRAPSS